MKKLALSALILTMSLSVFTGCGSKAASGAGIAKMGMGHITTIEKSKDLGTDKDGKEVLPTGQVDTIIVAAAFDKDGKVVKVTIDNAQTKVDYNKDLSLKSDVKAEGKTKVELGDAYGMVKASSIKKEWYQQIAELEKWMVGKTVEEIKGMKVVKKDDAHPSVPDVAELKSSVTVSVEGYIAGLEEAYKNAIDVKGAEKIGLGHKVSTASSKALGTKDGKEVLPTAQVDTVMATTAFDKDGKVVATLIDNAQTKVNFSKDGKVTSNKQEAPKTKVELGDGYGMIKASSIKKEWYQQIAELQKWMAGKKVDEIKAMKVVNKDESHPAVPDVAELKSSVTVSVQDYIAAVEEGAQKAK